MTNNNNTKAINMFESLPNNLLTAAVIGLMSWNLLTTNRLSQEVTELKATVNLQNSFTKELLDDRLKRLESWNQNLSNRLASVEEDIRSEKP